MKPNVVQQFIWGAVVLISLASCTHRTSSSQLNARVDQQTAERAFSIVEKIDYLPFKYAADGCYARQLYMNMELAVQGIPTSSQYIVTFNGTFNPEVGIQWGWHVAPMIWINGASEPTIIDPSLSSSPVARSEWILLAKPSKTPELFWNYGSNYIFSQSDRGKPGPTSADVLPDSIANIPGFEAGDIEHAARLMCAYLKASNEDDVVLKRLSQRTKFLVKELEEKGLLKSFESGMLENLNCP